jgi:hypothetical protein
MTLEEQGSRPGEAGRGANGGGGEDVVDGGGEDVADGGGDNCWLGDFLSLRLSGS